MIGNPPYIRLEDIPPETASLYRDAYPTMRGRADIYVAFFEAALRQLKTRASVPISVPTAGCSTNTVRNCGGW